MSLVVGVDADGVLVNMSAYNIREGKKYFKKEPVNPNAYHTRDIFGVSKKEEFIYGLRGGLNNYCKYESPMPYSVEVINDLSKQGMEFHEITARKFATFTNIIGKYYRHLFEEWLKNNKFNFKSIQYCSEEESPRDKLMGCSKLNVDVMIEDKPDVALYLASNGIKIILMDAPYNQDLKHENITRVYNWLEIKKKLEEMNKEKIEDNEFKKLTLQEKEQLTDEEKKKYFKNYYRYLKKLNINTNAINKGKKRFKLIHKIAYLPIKVIFNPKVNGKNNVPYQDGFIIASNHLNSYDQYLISYAMGNRHFSGFAASTIENTFRGKLFKYIEGSVFIDRNDPISKKNGEEELSARIAQNNIALIFPEGTRKNKDEEGKMKEQLPFKLGVVSMAQKTGAPILPTSIYYGETDNYVKFGELFYVSKTDDLELKNNELQRIILSMTRESVIEDEKNKKIKVKG